MIEIKFTGFSKSVRVEIDEEAISDLVRGVATDTEATLRAGMGSYPPASKPGTQYPARRTGALHRSVASSVEDRSAEVGTNVFYSLFLRKGTSKMARRKMSDSAMKEAAPRAWGRRRPFAKFVRG